MSAGYLVFVGDDECGRPDYIDTLLFRTKAEAIDYIIDKVNGDCDNPKLQKKLVSWLVHPDRALKVGLAIYEIRPLEFQTHQRQTTLPELFDHNDVPSTIKKVLTYIEQLNSIGTEHLYFPVIEHDEHEDGEFQHLARKSKIAVKATSDIAAGAMLFFLSGIINGFDLAGPTIEEVKDSNIIFIKEFVEYIAEKCITKNIKIKSKVWTIEKIRSKLNI